MSDTAIKVENLSKRYRIGLKEEMHDTLAGALTENERPPHPQPAPAKHYNRLGNGTDSCPPAPDPESPYPPAEEQDDPELTDPPVHGDNATPSTRHWKIRPGYPEPTNKPSNQQTTL